MNETRGKKWLWYAIKNWFESIPKQVLAKMKMRVTYVKKYVTHLIIPLVTSTI